MSKTITPFTAQLVVFETPLPAKEVLRRIDEGLHREKGGPANVARAMATKGKDRAQLTADIEETTAGGDFLLFSDLVYDEWLTAYSGRKYPVTAAYVMGNPIIAETMIRHEIRTALHVPPKVLVTEKEDHSGTKIIYHLPSSVIAIDDSNAALKEAAQGLDAKLDRFFTEVLRT